MNRSLIRQPLPKELDSTPATATLQNLLLRYHVLSHMSTSSVTFEILTAFPGVPITWCLHPGWLHNMGYVLIMTADMFPPEWHEPLLLVQ